MTRVVCHPNDNGRMGMLTATTLETHEMLPHLANSATGLVRRLVDIAQGDTQDARSGNVISVARYVDKLEFQYNYGTAPPVSCEPIGVRILIYEVTMQGATPAALNIADMLWTVAPAATADDNSSITAIYRPSRVVPSDTERQEAFRIVYDKKFWMQPLEGGTLQDTDGGTTATTARRPRRMVVVNLSWPKGKRIYYGSATAGDVQNPLIMAIFASRDNTFSGAAGNVSVSVRHASRLYFKDT